MSETLNRRSHKMLLLCGRAGSGQRCRGPAGQQISLEKRSFTRPLLLRGSGAGPWNSTGMLAPSVAAVAHAVVQTCPENQSFAFKGLNIHLKSVLYQERGANVSGRFGKRQRPPANGVYRGGLGEPCQKLPAQTKPGAEATRSVAHAATFALERLSPA